MARKKKQPEVITITVKRTLAEFVLESLRTEYGNRPEPRTKETGILIRAAVDDSMPAKQFQFEIETERVLDVIVILSRSPTSRSQYAAVLLNQEIHRAHGRRDRKADNAKAAECRELVMEELQEMA